MSYSIIPSSGENNLQSFFSSGGWTKGSEGFVQQTFLGASIADFNISAGFGDSISTLSATLVNDEYNQSDGTGYGFGDDPYHGGEKDFFRPPVVGSPVYFKFGKNHATVDQAFRQSFDDLYGYNTLPAKSDDNPWGYDFPTSDYDPSTYVKEPYHYVDLEKGKVQDRSLLWDTGTVWRGRNHFNFGGILQSYTENESDGGGHSFSVTVNDPREILSNVEVLLSNYQGTTFNNKNIINLYGFLEYDPSTQLLQQLDGSKKAAGIVQKFIDNSGNVDYAGVEADWNDEDGWVINPQKTLANLVPDPTIWSKEGFDDISLNAQPVNLKDQYYFGKLNNINSLPEFFPITGQGFSRRSDKGIPWYRISTGLAAMFEQYGKMPDEYKAAGFGGRINFRGYNYVVDFSGIPTERIPLLYFIDFDKIDLLSLAQELCEIISHELYVTLLPVIDHPACKYLYDYNQQQIENETPENMVSGIIRLDAIDKTVQPDYGAIKSYIENLSIDVKNRDIGFELSNVVTDKFVVGGQEVGMHFFSTERDRDELWVREGNTDNILKLQQSQWDLRTQLQQQAIPYYGLLGDKAVSIPRGFGPFQQILLDATSLEAFGVGSYYVATELELRAALSSYERWRDFLLNYNDVYIQDVSDFSPFFDALSSENGQLGEFLDGYLEAANWNGEDVEELINNIKDRRFAVSAPRCVFASDRPYMTEDGYPASPCSPPFGYPLYYKRATRIGIPQAGVASLLNDKTRVVTDFEQLKKDFSSQNSPMLRLSKSTLSKQVAKLEKQLNDFIFTYSTLYGDKYKESEKYKSLVSVVEESKKTLANYEILRENAAATGELLAEIEDMADPENGAMARFMMSIEKAAKKHEENAKKVYEFVKRVADENLGKKFLVRIPKSCNLNYSNSIQTHSRVKPFNVESGPFGFKPRPISANPVYSQSAGFTGILSGLREVRGSSPSNLFENYLQDYVDPAFPDYSRKLKKSENYTEGALKGNFNPFSEKWEWNYKPEPQGGFFDFNLFNQNITGLDYVSGKVPFSSLPLVIQEGLFPLDASKFFNDSNRIECYVRYNNSETLDFTGVEFDSMTQQTLDVGGQFIPDIVESLPNNNIDAETSFESIRELNSEQNNFNARPKSIAFVKCSIDEKLYLAPRLEKKDRLIWANRYGVTLPPQNITRKEIIKDCDVRFEDRLSRLDPIFTVPKDGGADDSYASWTDFERTWDDELKSWVVNTKANQLDDEHVYALVTVPGRIKSTIDTRWRDGPLQAFETVKKKHLMGQAVVKIPEFSKPNIPQPDIANFSLPCGKPEEFEKWIDAARRADELGLRGASQLDNGNYIPGVEGDWINFTIEQVTSARRLSKLALKGFALDQPQVSLGLISPSPVYPDLFVLPLMSMERCYGPWLSSAQIGDDWRDRYSDIGGRVEFVKDENLSPWNYAGYQLLNKAGELQAAFSNSLLLFSERGGFVVPEAPTGIAIAKQLVDSGPLVTAMDVSVGQDGTVETTVKMDLYTSKFGKMQKQQEMAISQVARQRQRLIDERNSSVRRGLGKSQTSADLVNTVMSAGGNKLKSLVSNVNSQLEANQGVEQKFDETMIVVGQNSSTSMSSSAVVDVMSQLDYNEMAAQLGTTVVSNISSIFQPVSNSPNPGMPSKQADNEVSRRSRIR